MIKKHITAYLDDVHKTLGAFPGGQLERVIAVLMKAHADGRQVFVFGNGGSAATASHFACDMNKCASIGRKKRFKIVCLNDNISTMMAYANDMSYGDIFVEQLKMQLKKARNY